MRTITKQWLQQKIADMEATRDDIPFGIGEDGTNTLAALRIALASLEAEESGRNPVLAYADSYRDMAKQGVESIPVWSVITDLERNIAPLYAAPPAPVNAEPVAWLWSHRKHQSEVTLVRPEDDERSEGAHWSGWSCQALYAEPHVGVSLPDYPETLPCPVMLEPGLRFGKGVNTRIMLGALQRRAEYHAELEAMTPEQREEHDAGMKGFAAMLQGTDGNSQVIPDGYALMPVEPTLEMIKAGANAASSGMLIPGMYRAMLAAAPQQEV